MKEIKINFNELLNGYYDYFLNHTTAPAIDEVFDFNFKEAVLGYFNIIKGNSEDKLKAQDSFFSNFSAYWKLYIDIKDYRNGHKLWEYLFGLSKQWDDKNKRFKLHKGSLYYFWGANYLFDGDVENAYILINQAVKEDIRLHKRITSKPDTPAYRFVSLNQKDHFLSYYVQQQISFIMTEIDKFNKNNKINFHFEELKSKFLDTNYIDEITLFSFIISKYLNLSNTQLLFFRNKFTNLSFISLLFDLTLIIEKLLKLKSNNKSIKNLTLFPLIQEVSNNNNLSISSDIGNFNTKLKAGFDKTLKSVLRHTYLLPNNKNLNNFETGLYITYAIRNHRAHNVKSLEVISKEHVAFFSTILQTLFYIIDSLY